MSVSLQQFFLNILQFQRFHVSVFLLFPFQSKFSRNWTTRLHSAVKNSSRLTANVTVIKTSDGRILIVAILFITGRIKVAAVASRSAGGTPPAMRSPPRPFEYLQVADPPIPIVPRTLRPQTHIDGALPKTTDYNCIIAVCNAVRFTSCYIIAGGAFLAEEM